MSVDHRPTSPHLTIYKKQITSVLSITHRITGLFLVAGMLLLVAWLWVVAYAPAYYDQLYACLSYPVGKLMLFGWTLSFFYHLSNGIRHLFWDIGKGFSIPQVNRSGWLVILFTLAMTMISWGYVMSSVAR